MGLRYDCAASVLLCTEDNSSIFGFDDDDDDGDGDDKEEAETGRGVEGTVRSLGFGQVAEKRWDFYVDALMALPPLQSEDCVASLLEKETQHLLRDDYTKRLLDGSIDSRLREDAIDWIEKVRSHYNFGPLTAYLSVNYLDRFLSASELHQGKEWMTQLLSVVCLSLAAKVEETKVPLFLDLQVEHAKYIFEARTIQRMELLVLGSLKWRMQAITPFSFIHYFLYKFCKESSPEFSSVNRSVELILGTIRGTEFLDFRPSEIAAAVALLALQGNQILEIGEALNCCPRLEKERILRCYDTIQNMALMKTRTHMNTNPSDSSAPRSPIGVLDVAGMSYKSDDITVGSRTNPHQTSPIVKRRKLEQIP